MGIQGRVVDLALHELDEAAERERRLVGLAHEETLQDHGVEVALGPANQEAVQLRAHEQIRGRDARDAGGIKIRATEQREGCWCLQIGTGVGLTLTRSLR